MTSPHQDPGWQQAIQLLEAARLLQRSDIITLNTCLTSALRASVRNREGSPSRGESALSLSLLAPSFALRFLPRCRELAASLGTACSWP